MTMTTTKKTTARRVRQPSGIEVSALEGASAIVVAGRRALLSNEPDWGPAYPVGRLCAEFLGVRTYQFRWAEKSGHIGRVVTETFVQAGTGRRMVAHFALAADGRQIGRRTDAAARSYTLRDIYDIVRGMIKHESIAPDKARAILVQVWARAYTAAASGV
jgi:hypothetical protein